MLLAGCALLAAGCGGGSGAEAGGPATAPPSVPVDAPSRPVAVSGRIVTSQNLDAGIAGAQIADAASGAVLATADAQGRFQIVGDPGGQPLRVAISAPGHLTRETGLKPGLQGVVADIIQLSPPFSLGFYRRLVRAASQGTDQMPGQPLAGWRQDSISVYMRTRLIDPGGTGLPVDTGIEVPREVLERTLKGLESTIAEVSSRAVDIKTVQYGPSVQHENEPGWLVVDFFDRERHPQAYSGFAAGDWTRYAQVRLGIHASPSFGCAPMGQSLAMHEFGHVFGLSHPLSGDLAPIMDGGGNTACTGTHFSVAERLHARIAHSRPAGNADPDRDPPGFVLLGR